MNYSKTDLILALKLAMRARHEDACREALRLLRPLMEKPEKEMAIVLKAFRSSDVDWLKHVIIDSHR